MSPTRPPQSRRPSERILWAVGQLAVGVVALVAFASNGDAGYGVAVLAIMVASVITFEVAQRRGLSIVGLLTGVGDERARTQYRQANARTGELMAYVLAVWAVVATAQGKENDTLLAIIGVYVALWALNIARVAVAARIPARQL